MSCRDNKESSTTLSEKTDRKARCLGIEREGAIVLWRVETVLRIPDYDYDLGQILEEPRA